MSSTAWSNLALGSSAAALLAALAPAWARWRQRRAVWLTEPARLLDPVPRAVLSQVVVLTLALVVIGAGWQGVAHLRTSFALLLAAFACLTTSHTQGVLGAGVGGLALAAAAVVTASVSRLPASAAEVDVNLCLGFAAAGGLFGWLARFWRQQLLDGVAWTTAGRLIPAAAAIGAGCTALGGIEAVRRTFDWWQHGVIQSVPVVRTVLAGLLLAAGMALAIRNAADWRRGWRDAPPQR